MRPQRTIAKTENKKIHNYDEKTKLATVEERNYFKRGDIVELFTPSNDIIELKIDKIYDEDNNLIEVVNHPLQVVKIPISKKIEKDSMIRIKRIDKDIIL